MLNRLNKLFPAQPDGSRQIYARSSIRRAEFDEVLLNMGQESSYVLGPIVITTETTKPRGYDLTETITVRIVTQQKNSS